MEQGQRLKIFTLLQREVQECRNSFLVTPLIVGGLLMLFMLGSVLLANRISVLGDSVMQVLLDDHGHGGMHVTISIDDDAVQQNIVITEEFADDQLVSEEWNFSREWTFNPQRKEKRSQKLDEQIESLNPVLSVLHALFMCLLLLVTINYLLGSLHQDRRDRSVLFWKSMPVSEWQEIGTKMATACFVVPALYIALSILTQLAFVILAMLLVWRMDMSASQVVLENVDFVSLFAGQLGGWLVWVLWTAPFYGWLLFSSAAARRSPLLLAVAIPLAILIVNEIFVGIDMLPAAIGNHIPHIADEDVNAMGFYMGGPQWLNLDYIGMLLGLGVTGALLAGAVWFRKHRFEM